MNFNVMARSMAASDVIADLVHSRSSVMHQRLLEHLSPDRPPIWAAGPATAITVATITSIANGFSNMMVVSRM